MQIPQNVIDYIERIGLNVPRICSVGVILACLTANPAAADPGEGTLFGFNGSIGELISIDPATGAATVISQESLEFPTPALARDPLTGTLYVGEGGGNPNIYTINATNGAATFVGDSGLGFAGISSLDFRTDGVLFAAVNIAGDGGTGADHLATIDTASGIATVVGPFGVCTGVPALPVDGSGSCDIEGIEGIAFDSDGNLWGVHSERGAAGMSGLYSIDPVTGAATWVRQLVDAMAFPASGGFVSMQFGCDGTTYLGSATALSASDGGTLATIGPGDLLSGSFTFAATASTGGSSLSALAFEGNCLVVPGDDVVVLPPDPDEPVTAVVQEVVKPGTISQFSDCVIVDDRGKKKKKLDLVEKVKETDTEGCNRLQDELEKLGPVAAKLKRHQRAFEFDGSSNHYSHHSDMNGFIAITLITSKNTNGVPDDLTKGVVISEEDAEKQGLDEPPCEVDDVSDSPGTVGVNLSGLEPSRDLARNWTITCNRTRSGGRFSDQLLAYPIRNVSKILPPNAQVNKEASEFRKAVGAELRSGCVNGHFLRHLLRRFNKAWRFVGKKKFAKARAGLDATTLIALDPDDNDPYGSCPNDPKGHLASRLMTLTYQVHRGRAFPDEFELFEINPDILAELPPFPGD